MIDQDLLNRVSVYIANDEPLSVELTKELTSNYKSLIEQNAELHKELAKLKGDKVFVCNKGSKSVRYENGSTEKLSKSHIRKYYKLITPK